MKHRNRLPADFNIVPPPANGDSASALDAAALHDLLAEVHTRDAVAALLHMLTRLANCGLDAGAPPLLRSAHTEV